MSSILSLQVSLWVPDPTAILKTINWELTARVESFLKTNQKIVEPIEKLTSHYHKE